MGFNVKNAMSGKSNAAIEGNVILVKYNHSSANCIGFVGEGNQVTVIDHEDNSVRYLEFGELEIGHFDYDADWQIIGEVDIDITITRVINKL
jgi:hypothetical protein